MLGKLLKHEFKQTTRVVPFVFLSGIIIALFTFISYQTNFESFQALSSVLMIVTCIGIPIITFVYMIQRFTRNLYGSEGYLMFTLPVKSSQLYWSKFISVIIWVVLSLLIGFGGILLFVYFVSGMAGMSVQQLWNNIYSVFSNNGSFLWGMAGYLLISFATFIFSFISVVFFSITLAHSSFSQKSSNGFAFLIYIVISIVMNTLESILTAVLPLSLRISLEDGLQIVDRNMLSMLSSGNELSEVLVGLGNFLITVPAAIIFIIFTIKLMRTKVNLK